MAERKRSFIWSHFTAVDDIVADCDLCRKAVRHCGNTSNLLKHIRKHHGQENLELQRRRKEEEEEEERKAPAAGHERRGQSLFREARNIQETRTPRESPPLSSAEETRSRDNDVLTLETANPASCTSEETSSHDGSVANVTHALNEQPDPGSVEALQIQQQRERKRQTLQLYETRRRQTIEERRRRLALMPEPRDGVYIQVKYGDGSARRRRFYLKQSIQILFDFAGSDDMATDVFHIQMSSSSTATPSTASGTLSELGFTAPSTVYVLWLGSEEVEERLSQTALVASSSPVQSSHSTILIRQETPADTHTEHSTAPCCEDDLLHKHKGLAASPGGAVPESVEGSVVALSWPWFVPMEEPSASPSHSSVTSLLRRRRPGFGRHRAELQADRAELQRERAELERERAGLERERAELEMERAELERERAELERGREREEAELEGARAALQRDREQVERSRRVLFLFHLLMQKL